MIGNWCNWWFPSCLFNHVLSYVDVNHSKVRPHLYDMTKRKRDKTRARCPWTIYKLYVLRDYGKVGRDGPPGRDGRFCFFDKWWTIPRLALQFWRQISTSCLLQECDYCRSKLSATNDAFDLKKYASWSNFTVSWKCRLSRMHTYNCSVIGCLNWTTVEVLKVPWIPCVVVYSKQGAVRV